MTVLAEADEFDLHDTKDIQRLGGLIGLCIGREYLSPLAKDMDVEDRAVFFAAFLAGPVGMMTAALGAEGARKVIEELFAVQQAVEGARMARAN